MGRPIQLSAVVAELGLSVCCGSDHLDRVVSGGYVGDLLSDVIANAEAGNIWVTMHGHVNIVAVSVLKDLAAIIVANGHKLTDDTVKRAGEMNIPILLCDQPAFEVVGQLSALGIHGTKN
jgi:predicted transcriptional regulator